MNTHEQLKELYNKLKPYIKWQDWNWFEIDVNIPNELFSEYYLLNKKQNKEIGKMIIDWLKK